MFTLYYAPGACSLAPHIVLEELGFAHTGVKLNLAQGDQYQPDYLAINPQGKVPTLIFDDKVLTENVAILTFLGGAWPQANLWPQDTWQQAQAVSRLAFFAGTVQIAYAHIGRPERYADGEMVLAEVKAKGRDNFWKGLHDIEHLLEAGQPWVLGEQYTVCDPYLLVFYRWAKRNGFEVGQLPRYSAHTERMLARPAVIRAFEQEGLNLDLS